MYKKSILIIFSVIVFCLLFLYNRNNDYSQTVIVDEHEVKISVFVLDEPMKIELIYVPRNDLEKFSWLKPLLFQFNGFELTIPESEWPKYAEGEWPKERYTEVKKYNKRIRDSINSNPSLWDGVYHELSYLVKCEFEEGVYLVAKLATHKKDGSIFGYRYQYLKYIDGQWIEPSGKNPNGKMISEVTAHSYTKALDLISNATIKVQSIDKLD